MKRSLRAQMVGFHHQCIEYQPFQFHEYYEFLKEAEEFGAAAGAYPDERDELMANAAHRYQLLLDWMSERLHLNTTFLNKGRIWFNFYADIAGRFGLGTQAYTTETKKPHIGVSEISLQDLYLLQLILLHEMQHATDFVNYEGLRMSIAERELRARISICQGLRSLRDQYLKLYQNALQDLTYWFVIFYHSDIKASLKRDYYDLLPEDAQMLLSKECRGVLFSPMVIRSLMKELHRDRIEITSLKRYAIDIVGKGLKLIELPLSEEESTQQHQDPDTLEAMMLEDDELAPSSMQVRDISDEDMDALTIDFSREVMTTKNKVTDWQPYDDSYQRLKEQAMVVIERDQIGFEPIQLRLDKGISHQIEEDLFPQIQQLAMHLGDMGTFRELDQLDLPPPVVSAQVPEAEDKDENGMPVHLQPLQYRPQQRHNIGDEAPTLSDMMDDLSDFVREKGGR